MGVIMCFLPDLHYSRQAHSWSFTAHVSATVNPCLVLRLSDTPTHKRAEGLFALAGSLRPGAGNRCQRLRRLRSGGCQGTSKI